MFHVKPKFERLYEAPPAKGLVTVQISATIPDQTMSMKEIADRFMRGLPLSQRTPVYEGSELYPDLAKMDISEIQQMSQQSKQLIADYKEAQKQQHEKEMAGIRSERDNLRAKLAALEASGEQNEKGS